eukprot:GEMP01084978.1.p1 GENE.GEMP01084978.1~~GEMP01084978.1.p1  ORF type:complete len:289 (+),score=58.52 GEMP01084978.1:87-953(+)
MIAQTWAAMAPSLFSGPRGGDVTMTTQSLKEVSVLMEGALTKIATFGVATKSTSELPALEKPWENFHKSFLVFMASIRTIGIAAKGSLLIEDLRSHATQMAKAYGDFENALPREKDMRTDMVARTCGKCIELVKRFEKLPLNDLQTIRQRLIQCMSQVRDAKRELEQTDDSMTDDDFSDGDIDEENGDDGEAKQCLAAALGDLDSLLNKVIRYCGDTSTEVSFLENIAIECKDIGAQVDGTIVAIDCGLPADFPKLCASLRKLEKEARELGLEIPADWDGNCRVLELW